MDNLNENSPFHPQLRLVQDWRTNERDSIQKECGADTRQLRKIEPALKIVLSPTGEPFAFELDPVTSTAVVYCPGNARSSLPSELANAMRRIFANEQISAAIQAKSYSENGEKALAFLNNQPREIVSDVEKQVARAFKTSPVYHLTFSLITAGGTPSSWEVQDALEAHIRPLLRAMSTIAEFKVSTQVHLFSAFSSSIQTFTHEGQSGSTLRQNDLTAFVNAAEWPLSPSIGSGPTFNFILYVPSRDQVPLSIENTDETSWLVPQWGSIKILNPPLIPHPINGVLSVPNHLTQDLLDSSFETFSTQLLSLLGVPPAEYAGFKLPIGLRLEGYKRLSALSLHMKAASSLGSLARLAQHLSSIPIPKHVAQLVENTMSNLTAANNAFMENHWNEGLTHARLAYEDSETAFFDKSMVGQVYFPDEHKIAVYLPLLGPIAVPLIVALIRELKAYVAKAKGQKA